MWVQFLLPLPLIFGRDDKVDTALIGSNGSEEKQQTHLPVTQKIAGVAPVGTANIGELALIG